MSAHRICFRVAAYSNAGRSKTSAVVTRHIFVVLVQMCVCACSSLYWSWQSCSPSTRFFNIATGEAAIFTQWPPPQQRRRPLVPLRRLMSERSIRPLCLPSAQSVFISVVRYQVRSLSVRCWSPRTITYWHNHPHYCRLYIESGCATDAKLLSEHITVTSALLLCSAVCM